MQALHCLVMVDRVSCPKMVHFFSFSLLVMHRKLRAAFQLNGDFLIESIQQSTILRNSLVQQKSFKGSMPCKSVKDRSLEYGPYIWTTCQWLERHFNNSAYFLHFRQWKLSPRRVILEMYNHIHMTVITAHQNRQIMTTHAKSAANYLLVYLKAAINDV